MNKLTSSGLQVQVKCTQYYNLMFMSIHGPGIYLILQPNVVQFQKEWLKFFVGSKARYCCVSDFFIQVSVSFTWVKVLVNLYYVSYPAVLLSDQKRMLILESIMKNRLFYCYHAHRNKLFGHQQKVMKSYL